MNNKNEMFDYPRVKESFHKIISGNPDEIINMLVKSGDEWMNGADQADDISFVVIKIK